MRPKHDIITHFTHCHQTSSTGMLGASSMSREELIAALVREEHPNIEECVTDRFAMFFELRGMSAVLSDIELRKLICEVCRVLSRFLHNDDRAAVLQHVLVLQSETPVISVTSLRLIVPGLVVNAPTALRMHAMTIWSLEALKDVVPSTAAASSDAAPPMLLRSKLFPEELQQAGQPRQPPTVQQRPAQRQDDVEAKWIRRIPNQVYLARGGSLAVADSSSYRACNGCNGSDLRCPTCMGHGWISMPNTHLQLRGVYGMDGCISAPQRTLFELIKQDRTQLFSKTLLRTEVDATAVAIPRGCPYVPTKSAANGRVELSNKPFAETNPSQKGREEITSLHTLQMIQGEVNEKIPSLKNALVRSVTRFGTSRGGSHVHKVRVGGEGAHVCFSSGSAECHADAQVWVEISAQGMRLRCNKCHDWKMPTYTAMKMRLRTRLSYSPSTNNGEGDFWYKLKNIWLPELDMIARGETPAEVRKSYSKKRAPPWCH